MKQGDIKRLQTKKVVSHIRNNIFFTRGYFDLADGTLLALVFFGALAILLPPILIVTHADTIFAAATFLFAIAAGYYIQNRHDRYSQLRSLFAEEASLMIGIYESASLIGVELKNKVISWVEPYIIRSYHHDLHDYVIATEQEFSTLLPNFDKIKERLEHQESVATSMYERYMSLNETREQIYVLGQDRLAWYDWFVLILLSGLILISLFTLGFDSVQDRVISVLLSMTLVVIVLTIRDLDSLHRNNKLMMYGTYDRVLDRMARPRIYLQEDIDRGLIVPDPEKDHAVIK